METRQQIPVNMFTTLPMCSDWLDFRSGSPCWRKPVVLVTNSLRVFLRSRKFDRLLYILQYYLCLLLILQPVVSMTQDQLEFTWNIKFHIIAAPISYSIVVHILILMVLTPPIKILCTLSKSACDSPLPNPLACKWFRVNCVFRNGPKMSK